MSMQPSMRRVCVARKRTPAASGIGKGRATLETRVGFRLCERGRSGLRLTTKGERFYALAKKLHAAADAFSSEARHMDKTLAGMLAIGLIGLIGHTPISENARVSDAIARFRQRDEAVCFVISVRPPGDLEERLTSGDVQIAIGYFWHRVPTLEYMPLFVERQVAYCGRGHPLFRRAGRHGPSSVADFERAWRTYRCPKWRCRPRPRKSPRKPATWRPSRC